MKYKNIQLKDVADIVMGQSPKSVFYNTDGKGIPFLQGVRTFGENYPQIDTWTTSYNRKAKSGEILFSVRAPVGRVNWANQDLAVGRGLATLKIKSGYSKEYLYYLFKKIGSHLNSLATGTVFTSINKKELEALELKIPVNLSDQEKIASYLQKIDQEIELNNQINDNLQELRHILYKQLIAKSALKTISIKELYSIKYGKTLPKSQLLRTGTKVFGAKGFMGYTERKPLVNKATVTITSRGSGAGFVSYIDEEEAFLTNNLLYLIDKTGLGLSFTYELIKSSKPSQFVTGSAQPQLTINNLKQLKLKIPTDRFIIEQFKNNTKRIEDCMSNNKIENNSLQKLRLAFLNYYF